MDIVSQTNTVTSLTRYMLHTCTYVHIFDVQIVHLCDVHDVHKIVCECSFVYNII